MSKRFIGIANGNRVGLGAYVAGIRKAKSMPDEEFPYGLTTWWPVTGREIVHQFRRGMHERITAAVSYKERGA